MSWVLFFLLSVYIGCMGSLIYGFFKVKRAPKTNLKPQTRFAIIVPFRNEASYLPDLLNSFSKLNYPTDLFEVMLVDDSSTDSFQCPIVAYQVSIIDTIRVSNSPKKDAIKTAMQQLKTNWVITTDADCVVPENWLLTFDNYIQQHKVSMLAAAVVYEAEHSFLYHFQQLDLMGLQAATIGSFGINRAFMCNGANFAYTKSLFERLNGFEGNDKIASGDDVFLLQKAVLLFPDKVHYLKSEETIVTTKATKNWKSLFDQRVRWAAKTSSYQSRFGKFLGLVVFFGNLGFVIGFLGLFFGFFSVQLLGLFFILKLSIDFVLLYTTNKFLFKNKIRYLVLSGLLYPFFCCVVALYSLFGSYEWKDRRFEM